MPQVADLHFQRLRPTAMGNRVYKYFKTFAHLGLLLALIKPAFAEQLPGSAGINTTEGRAKYARYLYYLVNGASGNYTIQGESHLQLFNSIFGAQGLGGVLYSNGFEKCDSIPTSGTASGTVTQGSNSMELNLNFSTGTKILPSFYAVDGGKTMDTRISFSASITDMVVEMKCSDSSTVSSGYILMDYPNYGVTMEGFFQQDSSSGAVNLDFYIKTVDGANNPIILPIQFKTEDGSSYTIFSAFLKPSSNNYNVVAVQGTVNSSAQIAFLQTTATVGSEVTTTPDGFGGLTSNGSTTVATECVEMSTHTTTTGCAAIPAPSPVTINGMTNSWTVNSMKALVLSTI